MSKKVYVLISWVGNNDYEYVVEGIFTTPRLAIKCFQKKKEIFKYMHTDENHIDKYLFEIKEVELNQPDLNIKRCDKIPFTGNRK